jgi:hypothetical protein
MVAEPSGDFGACGGVGADFAVAAELCSAWTGEAPSAHKLGNLRTQIESPEVMLNSFLSASSSRLDPC